jgi:hypothetical protein
MNETTPCCETKQGVPAHDRLDLVQQTEQYAAPECGTVSPATGKSAYCCFDCPTLIAKIKDAS